jgi:hypothetical protein
MPERQRALIEARRLVVRGADYDTVVARLVSELGMGERHARAITAEAFRPRPRHGMTLREELEAITRLLDAARPEWPQDPRLGH